MNLQTALSIIQKVCADYKGTLAEHQQIQAAIKALADRIEDKKEKGKK